MLTDEEIANIISWTNVSRHSSTVSNRLIKNLLTDRAELLEKLKDARELEKVLYRQRDEYRKRAEHPESAWSSYVDGANWAQVCVQTLLRRIHKKENHGERHFLDCCYCQEALEYN